MGDILQNKIQDADFSGKDVAGIEGNTVVGRADWLKNQFDKAVKQVLTPRHNALIDDLVSTDAADQIGAQPLVPGGAETVGEQLGYLKEQISGAILSKIPDGTVTDAKLSDEAGQVKARLLEMEQQKASLDSPEFTGEPTAPTAALGDSSAKLANTAYVQGELQSVSAHMGNVDAHVTADKKAGWDAHAANAAIHLESPLALSKGGTGRASSSLDNLLKAMGGALGGSGYTADLNACYYRGLYACHNETANMPLSSGYGVCICIPYNVRETSMYDCKQLFLRHGDNVRIWQRTCSSGKWSAWQLLGVSFGTANPSGGYPGDIYIKY